MQTDFWNNHLNLQNYIATIGKPRLSKYFHIARGNAHHALQLYHWNIKLSQSLYLPLQCWEIALRNRMNDFLCSKFGQKWHLQKETKRILYPRDIARLDQALKRQQQKLQKLPSADQITSDLSAGFWVALLGARYHQAFRWQSNMRRCIFNDISSLDIKWARQSCDDLLALRNRVAHHEPIFHLDLLQHRAALGQLMAGLCAATHAYVEDACTFTHVWQERPPI